MGQTVDGILDILLRTTLRLEQAVQQKDLDPEEWLPILDEREHLINEMQGSGLTGAEFTDSQRKKMEQISETNQRILPLIGDRMQGVQQKLNNLQKTKLARNSYNDAGPNGYGAFFDRKK